MIEHLIKYYCFSDNKARNHCVEEIAACIPSMYRLKSNKKYPTAEFIFNSLWDDLTEKRFQIEYKAVCEQYGEPSREFQDTKTFVVDYMKWLSNMLSEQGAVLRVQVTSFLEDYEK